MVISHLMMSLMMFLKRLYVAIPHVFGDATAENEEEALARWNNVKAQEKSAQNNSLF